MLQVTYNDADRILLDMADAAEAAEKYDQHTTGKDCGTPACMMGTYGWQHPETAVGRFVTTPGASWGDEYCYLMLEELELSNFTGAELFGVFGCGFASRDGKKAAAYVREFVRKRALARIEK